jgi:hypothetical protein
MKIRVVNTIVDKSKLLKVDSPKCFALPDECGVFLQAAVQLV